MPDKVVYTKGGYLKLYEELELLSMCLLLTMDMWSSGRAAKVTLKYTLLKERIIRGLIKGYRDWTKHLNLAFNLLLSNLFLNQHNSSSVISLDGKIPAIHFSQESEQTHRRIIVDFHWLFKMLFSNRVFAYKEEKLQRARSKECGGDWQIWRILFLAKN